MEAEGKHGIGAMATQMAMAAGEETFMKMLEGIGITHRFGGLMAVDKAEFHVEQGEIVGLIGPNGAGKTTLFNIVSGAIKPTSGRILFKGEDITGMKPHLICHRGMARTFQTTRLFTNMSAFENVRLALL